MLDYVDVFIKNSNFIIEKRDKELR